MKISSNTSVEFFISDIVGENSRTDSLLDYIKESCGVDLFEGLESEFQANGLEIRESGAYGDIHYTVECDLSEVLATLTKMEDIAERFFEQYPLEQAYAYFEAQHYTNLTGLKPAKYHQAKRVYKYFTKRLFR